MRYLPVKQYDFQNPGLHVDGYKTGHINQFPDNTTFCYSNFTPRSTKHLATLDDFDDRIVFFGLNGLIQWYLINEWNDKFFNRPVEAVVSLYQKTMDDYLGPGIVGTDHIRALHELGYLPILIKALPEGSRVNVRVAMWTIQNTLPEFFWLTNYLETQLSAQFWKSPTTATTAFEFKRLFIRYAHQTGVPVDSVDGQLVFSDVQGHDFAMRGMSGCTDAIMQAAAHLTSHHGTDTVPAILYIKELYGDDSFVGCSVPATEHAVMCMGGKDDEVHTIYRLIAEIYPKGIVSIVSDTWDFWNTLCNTTKLLKPEIMARDGKVVFRPDSGNPADIICGTARSMDYCGSVRDACSEARYAGVGVFTYGGAYYEVCESLAVAPHGAFTVDGLSYLRVEPTPEMMGAVQVLWDNFGGTETDKGFKVLDSHVGLIYGDSINLKVAEDIFQRLITKGFASNNIVFGVGSFTYQFVTRDTIGSAIKATYGCVNGEYRELFKDPKTDNGVKKSARGLIRIEGNDEDGFTQFDQQSLDEVTKGLLRPVFYEGKYIDHGDTISVIRERLNKQVY